MKYPQRLKTIWGNISIDGRYYRFHSGKYYKRNYHRVIYEIYNKITLCPWVVVHHIDGNKLNNCILNLEMKFETIHQSEHMIGNKFCVGRKYSKETKEKMSKSCKKYYERNIHWRKGICYNCKNECTNYEKMKPKCENYKNKWSDY